MGLYITQCFREANLSTKLALIFLTAALYLGWYGYCTASWGRVFPTADSDYFIGYGVWRIADSQFQRRNASSGSLPPLPVVLHSTVGWLLAWYGAFQAFATLGFICVNLGYILIVLLVYVAPCKANTELSYWNGINNIFGSVCWLVAVIVFGINFDDTYDIYPHNDPTLQYSFYLAVVVVALQLAAGIVLLVNTRGGGGGGGGGGGSSGGGGGGVAGTSNNA